jgi:DNA-binding transcriptional ArsR family regulator
MTKENDKLLKALVSDTRRDIVKTLSDGDRTPSDLSKLLGKSKSTIVEHLQKLIDADLVEKIERPGHKWVFYTLTRKGESYVSKKSQRLIIILSSVLLSIIGGIFSLIRYLSPLNTTKAGGRDLVSSPQFLEEVAVTSGPSISNIWLLYLSIGLFVLALIGIFVLIIMKKKEMVKI